VKLGDLGLSAMRISTANLQKCVQSTYPDISSALRVLLWRAPELLRAPMPANGTQRGDVYSVGIVIQQLMQRRGPYERNDTEFEHPDAAGNSQLSVCLFLHLSVCLSACLPICL